MEQILIDFGLTFFTGLVSLTLVAIPFAVLNDRSWRAIASDLRTRATDPSGGLAYAVLLAATFAVGLIVEDSSRHVFEGVNDCLRCIGVGPIRHMEPEIRTAVFFERRTIDGHQQQYAPFAAGYTNRRDLLAGALTATAGSVGNVEKYHRRITKCAASYPSEGVTRNHHNVAIPVFYYASSLVMAHDPSHRELRTILDQYHFARSISMAALLGIPLSCIVLLWRLYRRDSHGLGTTGTDWRRNSGQSSPDFQSRPVWWRIPEWRRLAGLCVSYWVLAWLAGEAFETEVKAHARRVYGYGLRPAELLTGATASSQRVHGTLPDGRSQPSQEFSDQDLFNRAVEDAVVALPDEISNTLTAVTPHNRRLRWNGDLVLVVCWTHKDHPPLRKFESLVQDYAPGQDNPPSGNRELIKDTWVTVVPDLEEFCDTLSGRLPDRVHRVRQKLGLRPEYHYTHFVEMWVNRKSLFRPTPDPEIEDTTAILDFPDSPGAVITEQHRQWFEKEMSQKYDLLKGYPWTRLGYTYDWGNPDSEVGLSEFVILKGQEVQVERVHTNLDYLN